MNSCNNSVHRTLGRKPTGITSAVVGDVREEVFFNRPPSKKATSRLVKLKVFLNWSIFAKGHLPNWAEEIFTVAAINRKTSPLT